MSFKRNDVQEYIEYELRCFDLENWPSYKPSLLNWKVSSDNLNSIKRCIKSDVESYYFKALQTFSQAIQEMSEEKYAWSIMKLYYTTFYLLRCDILLANYIFVRCGGMYYCKAEIGEKMSPFRKNNVRGDHQLTIALAKKLYDDEELNDPIFGNEINGKNIYIWLMKNRERVNYQMKNFTDPYPDGITSYFESYFKEKKLFDLLTFYKNNKDFSVCFDLDHAILSVPFKKLDTIYAKIKDDIEFSDTLKRKIIALKRELRKLEIDKNKLYKLMA